VTVFEGDFSYKGLQNALKGSLEDKILYTVEFFPEEGKYHFTGHRKCQVRYSSADMQRKGRVCPVCGRVLTVGVVQRVTDLAEKYERKIELTDWLLGDQKVKGIKSEVIKRPPYVMMVPLQEIISEALSVGVQSKTVQSEYEKIVHAMGTEFQLLLFASPEELKKVANEKVVEGIMRVRDRNLFIDPGYDGIFGVVKIWGEDESVSQMQEQISLF